MLAFFEPYNNAVSTARTCYSSRVSHLNVEPDGFGNLNTRLNLYLD